MSILSLALPGSPSVALTTTIGAQSFASAFFTTALSLRPKGNAAPPWPRRSTCSAIEISSSAESRGSGPKMSRWASRSSRGIRSRPAVSLAAPILMMVGASRPLIGLIATRHLRSAPVYRDTAGQWTWPGVTGGWPPWASGRFAARWPGRRPASADRGEAWDLFLAVLTNQCPGGRPVDRRPVASSRCRGAAFPRCQAEASDRCPTAASARCQGAASDRCRAAAWHPSRRAASDPYPHAASDPWHDAAAAPGRPAASDRYQAEASDRCPGAASDRCRAAAWHPSRRAASDPYPQAPWDPWHDAEAVPG